MSPGPGPRRRAVRAVLLAVTAWVAVVAVGSALVWAVISRAGEGVVGAPAPAADRTPSASPSRSARPTPHPTDTDSPSGPRTSEPTDTDSPVGPGTTEPTDPGTSPVASQQGTWTGTAGSVTARCTGAAIAYVSAIPRNGYRLVEWEGDGEHELKVTFAAGGEEGRETEVRGECRSGVPAFEAQGGED